MNYPQVGEAAGALCAVAELRSDKDPIGAIDDLAAVAKLSQAWGSVPSLTAMEAQTGYIEQVVDKAQWILARHADSAELWERARLLLKDLGAEPRLRYAVRSELVVTRLAVFRDMIDRRGYDDGRAHFAPEASPFAKVGVIRNAFEANWIDYWRKVNRLLPPDDSDYATALERIEALEEDTDCPHASLEINIRWAEAMNRGAMPNISNRIRAAIIAVAKRRMLEAAIEAQLLKLRTGRFPDRVSQIDPADNRPLRVRLLPEGLLIYTVSLDRTDDNGVPWSPKAGQGSDESFFVPSKPGVLPADTELRKGLMLGGI